MATPRNDDISNHDSDSGHARDDYDSPWKDALELYFNDFIAFFFVDVYAEIAGAGPSNFLTKSYSRLHLKPRLVVAMPTNSEGVEKEW